MEVFVVYRRKHLADGRWHKVATFRKKENAEKFLEEQNDPQMFMEVGTATVKDLSLARD